MRRETAGQLGRFIAVGLMNTLISLVVYSLLLGIATPYVLAAPIAYGAGAVNGYVWSQRWTFRARDTARARVLYVCVQLSSALSTAVVVWFFVRVAGLGETVAFLVTIPVVTLCAFEANRRWTFADRVEGA